MRLDVLIFTNEQAWLREVGGGGEAGEAGRAGEAGEAEGAEGDEGDCVGAGFTTIFLVTPRCN
ncbi:hypothetical protein [Coleofasciculus sp. E2-BRE-01]|uniref:hypothetical protein n=1 Tax=Coleofasciculus sp. E2-BRE-01 TaxID=3069524 RepID=UPI0032FDAF85